MVKTAHIGQESGVAEASADLGRLAADMLRNSPAFPMHPLMAHPAAAFAAAAAIGFGLSSQMAGAFFGALQGAVEASTKLAVALDENRIAGEAPARKNAEAGEAKPAAVVPFTKAGVVEAPKPVEPKPAVAKVEPKPVVTVAPKSAPAKAKAAAKTPVVPAEAAAIVEKLPAAARSRKATVKADDLKMISGIGPKLEQVLNGRGILRFADIAAWSDADVQRYDTELGFEGRIGRDDWVGQAKALAAKATGRK
ncbi:MAG: 5' DNA nuclease [Rhizobiaceae bacterium]|nr:5' DNA nuclease [Rhizobiaceae bacterium]